MAWAGIAVATPIEHPVGRLSLRARARERIARALGRRDRLAAEDLSVAGVLDLLEEHFYVGEITADGRYVALATSPMILRFFGGAIAPGAEVGQLWESLVHRDDWETYLQFNR